MILFRLTPTITINDRGLGGVRLTRDEIERARDLRICHIVEHSFALKKQEIPVEIRVKLDALRSGEDVDRREFIRNELESELTRLYLEQFDFVRQMLARPAGFSQAQMIIPGLFISAQGAALNKVELQDMGITHICMCMSFRPPFPHDFEYLVLNVVDNHSQDIKSKFEESYHFITRAYEKPEGKVLIHCAAGISRSSTIAIAYLIRRFNLTGQEALAMVRHARPYVSPNDGFAAQLLLYEQEVRYEEV